MSELYLVRHGQAAFGSADYDQLTPLGRDQCAWLARHWSALGRGAPLLFAGPLRRQQDSAAQFAAGLAGAGVTAGPVETVAGLEEYDHVALIERFAANRPGVPSFADCWRDRRTLHRTLERALAAWTGPGIAGCAEFGSFRERCAAALERVMAAVGRGRVAVVFASAGSLGAALAPVAGLADAAAMRLTLNFFNTGVSKLLFSGSSRALESLNAVPHLERPGLQHLITQR